MVVNQELQEFRSSGVAEWQADICAFAAPTKT
jgi:hypothetical protein